MTSSGKIKNQSKIVLKNNWTRAIAVLGVTAAVSLIFSYLIVLVDTFISAGFDISFLGGDTKFIISQIKSLPRDAAVPFAAITAVVFPLVFLFKFLIEAPITLGSKNWHFALVSGDEPKFSRVFCYFTKENYSKSVAYSFNSFIRVLAWDALPAIPFIFFIAMNLFLDPNDEYAAMIFSIFGGFASLGLIGAFVVHIIVTLRFFLVPYIIAMNPSIPINEAFRTSIRYMKGYKAEVFVLNLSFIGWNLLKIFAVPIIYVSPYYETSVANCAKWIIISNLEKEKEGVL